MHPYYDQWGRTWRWTHHRPSRLVWFLIGAGAATYFFKRKEAARFKESGYCIRAPLQQPELPAGSTADIWSTRGVTKAINDILPADTQTGDWAEEKKRAMEIQQQAGDKLAELSEATLDTVLTTVEVLKTKLAEYRVEREKRQQEEGRQKDDSV